MEFRYDHDKKEVVRVSEEVVYDDVTAELQEQVDAAQTTLVARQQHHEDVQAQWQAAEGRAKELKQQYDEAEVLAAEKATELETSLGQLHDAEEDLKSAEHGRDSFAEAHALQSQVAESRPEDEAAEDAGSEEVDVTDRIHAAEEAAA
jgi:DNA repair exonuclease SbcCD ATPase subunit